MSDRSDLISQELEGQLTQLFQRLTQPVAITCLLGADEKSSQMAAFLIHLNRLSDKVLCRFVASGEAPALEEALDGTLLPATGVARPGETPRMVFHGVPGGKEINAFAAAILLAGGAGKELDKYTLKDIAKVTKPTNIRVCVSLGCQHCSQLVSHAHRVAWENPQITAHMIDANLYPDLVKEYNIQRVPITLINDGAPIPGGKTMAELTTLLAKSK